MQSREYGYRGLTLLMELNWDRVLYVFTILFALGASAWLGTLLMKLTASWYS